MTHVLLRMVISGQSPGGGPGAGAAQVATVLPVFRTTIQFSTGPGPVRAHQTDSSWSCVVGVMLVKLDPAMCAKLAAVVETLSITNAVPLAVAPAIKARGGLEAAMAIATLIAAERLDDRIIERALGLLRELDPKARFGAWIDEGDAVDLHVPALRLIVVRVG